MHIDWRAGYDCSGYGISRIARKLPGVYLLCLRKGNNNWEVFYVGNTTDLLENIQIHFSESESNNVIKERIEKNQCAYFFSFIFNDEDRNSIEKFLFDRFSPDANDSDPGGNRTVVNLPEVQFS